MPFFSSKKSTPAVDPSTSAATSEFIGLKNQGRTCHLNTVLQSLFMTSEFRKALRECAAGSELAPLPDALCALFEKLETSSKAVSTKPLAATLKRLGLDELNEQQDAHDIWLRLNDRLETELKSSPRPRLMQDLFEGKQRGYVTCGTCGHTSETFETFSCIELAFPSSGEAEAEEQEGEEESREPLDVQAALRARLKEESLCGDAQYECDKCKCKRDAVRGVRFATLPPILSFHLARFRYKRCEGPKPGCGNCWVGESDGEHRLVKLTTPLVFGTTLGMEEFAPTAEDAAKAAAHAAKDAAPAATPAAAEEPAAAPAATSAAAAASKPADAAAPAATDPAAAPGSPSLTYELYAVVMHAGSPSDGHYYALIKDTKSQRWFQFNDERVLPMSESELQDACGRDGANLRTACAYMLLYRRV